MSVRTVAIQSPGDMGSGVGRDLVARGFRVVTCLTGRSERSHRLARAAGIDAVDSLEALVASADLVLSILPPAAAESFAGECATAFRRTGSRPAFADCNAIAPTTARRVADRFAGTGATFIDAGIIGLAPGKSSLPTRFYCSGPDTSALEALGGPQLRVQPLGGAIGRASAMKMVYAATTKGTFTLHAATLTAARVYGLSEPFHAELEESRPAELAAMHRIVPRLPLDAARWVGEMHEISETLAAAGLPAEFHQGAAQVFELLTRTPIAAETRETVDPSRTLADALDLFVSALDAPAARGAQSGDGMAASSPRSSAADARTTPEDRTSLVGWLAEWGDCIGALDFRRARSLFDRDVVGFGTCSDLLVGLDDLETRQWRAVWPTIAGFRFDLEGIWTDVSADRQLGHLAAGWTSTGLDENRRPFARPGRCTVTLRRAALDAPWLGTHTHFSLNPGTPAVSHGKLPIAGPAATPG